MQAEIPRWLSRSSLPESARFLKPDLEPIPVSNERVLLEGSRLRLWALPATPLQAADTPIRRARLLAVHLDRSLIPMALILQVDDGGHARPTSLWAARNPAQRR